MNKLNVVLIVIGLFLISPSYLFAQTKQKSNVNRSTKPKITSTKKAQSTTKKEKESVYNQEDSDELIRKLARYSLEVGGVGVLIWSMFDKESTAILWKERTELYFKKIDIDAMVIVTEKLGQPNASFFIAGKEIRNVEMPFGREDVDWVSSRWMDAENLCLVGKRCKKSWEDMDKYTKERWEEMEQLAKYGRLLRTLLRQPKDRSN